MNGLGTKPPTEDTLIMRPLRWARICGKTALVMRMRPKTLTSNTPCAWATEISSAAPLAPTPALLTKTSSRPKRAITCPTTLLTDSSLVTSRSSNVTPSPGATREVWRLVPITRKPASASASVAALPMPDDAPVTSATGRGAVITSSQNLELRSSYYKMSAGPWARDQRDLDYDRTNMGSLVGLVGPG